MARYIKAEDMKKEVLQISTSPLNEWDTWGVLNAIDRVETADVINIKEFETWLANEYFTFERIKTIPELLSYLHNYRKGVESC